MTDGNNGRPPFGAVLCDVDNVVRSFDSSRLQALERAAGVAEGSTRKDDTYSDASPTRRSRTQGRATMRDRTASPRAR